MNDVINRKTFMIKILLYIFFCVLVLQLKENKMSMRKDKIIYKNVMKEKINDYIDVVY